MSAMKQSVETRVWDGERTQEEIRRQERAEQRRKWQEEENQNTEASKAKMAKEYGLPRDEKFEKAWDIAWSHGHSEGYYAIEMHFGELAELLK